MVQKFISELNRKRLFFSSALENLSPKMAKVFAVGEIRNIFNLNRMRRGMLVVSEESHTPHTRECFLLFVKKRW